MVAAGAQRRVVAISFIDSTGEQGCQLRRMSTASNLSCLSAVLDRREDVGDVRLARLGRHVGRSFFHSGLPMASQIGAQAWPWIVK